MAFISHPLPVTKTAIQLADNRRVVRCALDPHPLFSRRALLGTTAGTIAGALLTSSPQNARAGRPEGVNRPDLLPKEFTTVMDLENFLARGQEQRLEAQLADLEKKTGYKLRVLTQRFPQTPGLAVRSYWGLDDDSVLLVADYFGGNQLLKFNVGAGVDKLLPPRFWSVLASSLGNKFYVEKHGEAGAIITACDNIRACLIKGGCATPPYTDDSKF